ncbi:MAG: hypothetical protein A2494_00390 [Candidatus Lloydbacteria bacterium RIFOXYC12_FULL_46_25]|uniref:Uncharacterized protein n=1 Tax=Candidatus Lloydbacteria bacterium RIFOXYC12_FULL_46_25 TaxID=1798670 RepID=A0A1G2E3F7_9BACT|nr:MAG: hypothetical protein A2494_00390 [Candidatus Lloydbacteria bacterium RIFOXYC12_FULL_46_25]
MKDIGADVEKMTIAILGISLLFWGYYLLSVSWNTHILYFFLLLILGGIPVYYLRSKIANMVNSPKVPLVLRFFGAGYLMVLFEGLFAAFANNLHEGFEVILFGERILQFWAFNIFAFSGLFVAWFFLRTYFFYSNKEVFYITGIFGVYVELLSKGLGDIFSLALLIVPMIFVYGLIASPMSWVIMKGEKRIKNKFVRYILPILVIFICSIPFMFTLNELRCAYPDTFPPRTFIPSQECIVW